MDHSGENVCRMLAAKVLEETLTASFSTPGGCPRCPLNSAYNISRAHASTAYAGRDDGTAL